MAKWVATISEISSVQRINYLSKELLKLKIVSLAEGLNKHILAHFGLSRVTPLILQYL